MPVSDAYQVTVYCQAGNQVSANVLHYTVTSETGTYTQQELANAISTAIGGVWKPIISNLATYKGIILAAMPITPVSAMTPSTSATGIGSGGATGLLPKQICGIITKRTVGRGPTYRGRVFTPFPDVSANASGGAPTAGFITALANAGVKVLGLSLIPNGGSTVALAGMLNRRIAGLLIPLTAITAQNKFGEQHRRSDYGKVNVSPV
jgi:hypothetical protein